MYAMDWEEVGVLQWRIWMRCPQCEVRYDGVFGEAITQRLDEAMDIGYEDLLADYRRGTHANMAQEIDFFVRALDADVIVPSDF